MDRHALLALINKLELPKGRWAAFGGACLAVHDIRPSKDLDLFVTNDLYVDLKDQGWEERTTNSTGSYYLYKKVDGNDVQAFVNCGDESWPPDPAEYIKNPKIVEGMPFMPLKELYKWKAATRRPKDVIDLKLIEKYYEEL